MSIFLVFSRKVNVSYLVVGIVILLKVGFHMSCPANLLDGQLENQKKNIHEYLQYRGGHIV